MGAPVPSVVCQYGHPSRRHFDGSDACEVSSCGCGEFRAAPASVGSADAVPRTEPWASCELRAGDRCTCPPGACAEAAAARPGVDIRYVPEEISTPYRKEPDETVMVPLRAVPETASQTTRAKKPYAEMTVEELLTAAETFDYPTEERRENIRGRAGRIRAQLAFLRADLGRLERTAPLDAEVLRLERELDTARHRLASLQNEAATR